MLKLGFCNVMEELKLEKYNDGFKIVGNLV